jgi:hypothetical protein
MGIKGTATRADLGVGEGIGVAFDNCLLLAREEVGILLLEALETRAIGRCGTGMS